MGKDETEIERYFPTVVNDLSLDELQKFGITFKKAVYIQSMTRKIVSGEFNIQELETMSDEEICTKLSELDGIGTWTAEMLMIHSMQRPNILSYGDLAIIRGLRMIYHHQTIDKAKFERYKNVILLMLPSPVYIFGRLPEELLKI